MNTALTHLLTDESELKQSRVEAIPFPVHNESQVVLVISRVALTTNNITDAAFGDAIRYWDFVPTGAEGWGPNAGLGLCRRRRLGHSGRRTIDSETSQKGVSYRDSTNPTESRMSKISLTFILLATTAAGTTVSAQEIARVLSSTPVVQKISMPCATTTTGAPPQCTTQTIYEYRTVGYKAVYEYAGKQYTVQLPQDPGPTLKIRIAVVPEPNPVAGAQPPQPQGAVSTVSDPALYADPNAVMMMAPGVSAPGALPAPAYVYYDAYPGYVGYYNSPYYGVWGPTIALGLYGGYRGGWYGRGGGHHGRR